MADKINAPRRCVIIAGSPEADVSVIKEAVRGDDMIICADRGYAVAREAEIVPNVIVGDFDSYGGELPGGCEIVRLRPEKDDTDTLHCVKLALARGFKRFLLVAATGGRLDHTLGNICVLEYLARHGAEGAILSRNETVRLLTVGDHRFEGYRGKTFSVLPFGCGSVTLSYEGAKYPLKRGILRNSEPVGVSNIFISDAACVTVHCGQALLLLYRAGTA